mgnify:FL=1|jgi:hypothetical protein
MKKERRHFRKQFENDYLLDETTLVTGVKFLRAEKNSLRVCSTRTSTVVLGKDI